MEGTGFSSGKETESGDTSSSYLAASYPHDHNSPSSSTSFFPFDFYPDDSRLLLIGDSVDRVLFEHLVPIIPQSFVRSSSLGHPVEEFNEEETIGDDGKVLRPTGKKPPGGYARTLVFPSTKVEGGEGGDGREEEGMIWDFLHFYGLDEADIWQDKGSHESGGPATLTARFERLVEIWGHNHYDVICLGSGLWDVARYQRESYTLYEKDDFIGLPVEFIEQWISSARHLISLIRTAFPNSRIVYRIIHNPRSSSGGWFLPPHLPSHIPKSQPFTPLRIHQMQQAQLALVESEGIEMIPFGLMTRGQDERWLKDDIHQGVAGSAILAELLMEKLAGY